MMENKVSTLTRILVILFVISTVMSLFIVLGNMDTPRSFYFLIGYLFFAIFLFLYIPLITFFNARKLNWADIKKRLFKFFTLLIVFGTTNVAFDYVFRPQKLDLLRDFSIPLGLAFGISFIDVTFLKKK